MNDASLEDKIMTLLASARALGVMEIAVLLGASFDELAPALSRLWKKNKIVRSDNGHWSRLDVGQVAS